MPQFEFEQKCKFLSVMEGKWKKRKIPDAMFASVYRQTKCELLIFKCAPKCHQNERKSFVSFSIVQNYIVQNAYEPFCTSDEKDDDDDVSLKRWLC